MGLQAYAQHLSAESACAEVGLLYPQRDAGTCAPWHLPGSFGALTVEQLPPHPVIDPAFLAASLGASAPGQNAVQALAMLAGGPPLPALWAGLPLHGASLTPSGPAEPPARVAVCLHLFYPELWPQLHAQLSVIPEPWDLFVSVPAFAATPAWREILRDHPRVRFLRVPNRGRDVAPFLAWLRSGAWDGYDVVCKLHGKRSPHMQGGDAWRDELLRALLGSAENVKSILAHLRRESALVMLGPSSSHRQIELANGWAKNRVLTVRLARLLALKAINAQSSFFAGTMFWFKPTAFNLVRSSALTTRDFPLEMGQTDGTLAHALERLLASLATASGGSLRAWSAFAPSDADT
jgi:lipopolysaccharide biosynthesis protein